MLSTKDQIKSHVKSIPVLGPVARRGYLALFGAGGITDHLRYLRYSVFGKGWRTVEFDGQPVTFRCSTLMETRRVNVALRREQRVVAMLRELSPPGTVMYDVGANVGTHTLALADAVGTDGTVIAFEPHSKTFEALEKNVARNGFGNVKMENRALGSETGSATLHIEQDNPGVGSHSLLRRTDTLATTETIGLIRGDEYATRTDLSPDLIKVDVEGAELSVLKGLEQTLRNTRPRLVVEVHDTADGDAVRSFLRDCGYDLYTGSVEKDMVLAK